MITVTIYKREYTGDRKSKSEIPTGERREFTDAAEASAFARERRTAGLGAWIVYWEPKIVEEES